MRARIRDFALSTALVLVLSLSIGAGVSAAAPVSSKILSKCQKAAQKGAAKFAKIRLKGLVACTQALVSCHLANELSGEPIEPCREAARSKCEGAIAKADAAAAKVAESMDKRCADIPTIWLRSRRGLGFRDSTDACAALDPPGGTADLGEIADCLSRAALCATDDLLEALVPRAYEVLDAAGILAGHPLFFACLDPRAASPASGSSTRSELLGCLKAIADGNVKVSKARQKGLQKCAAKLLGCRLESDRLEASLAEAEQCLDKQDKACDAQLAKIAATEGKRDQKTEEKCAAIPIADLKGDLGFSFACPAATTPAELSQCIAAAARAETDALVGTVTPRTCPLLSETGRISGKEATCVPSCGDAVVEGTELCDDGNADDLDSCTNACAVGPTAFETLSVPSAAHPANTPDGTPANAVPPGSTLATQFGSTVFDLNQATYTRFYVPGAGEPDAVLILVPGFAGGAHDFKNLAEHLLVRAAGGGAIVLEVWAFDRRTNQLEDLSGANLAEAELDPKLALDWFFGSEMGFSLDPRLTRRAVFHAGEDVAFIANFSPHVFMQDIDAVVEQARALSSSPAVFLGGHSLGTSFAARYAATDFDPGPGSLPGYSKLAGLVMFEGLGGSLPTGPPPSDDLDLIIAKADGGLYHAVKNGDARCVDGTPCPNGDSDCAGVPLPAGAVSNRCVEPTEAYLGADLTAPLVLVTPQVQAAGEIAGIQGILDPEGLILVQQDFGSGPAVDKVAGLGILGILPASSTRAGVGFFLDDDFSPVSAFQASLGFSNNGPNLPFFGVLLPQPAWTDPYRLWIGIDSPQPPQAIPNNGGPPSTWDQINGQEKEVSNLDVMFTALMAGDTDFGDWYFPSSGLSVIEELDVGTVWPSIDSSALSVGRGRPDIANMTEASGIDIPVISFGGTNGITPTAGAFKFFAESIAPCSAPSCDGSTPRVVDGSSPVFPVFAGVAGGYEVYLSEGYAHIDVLQAEDDPSHNNVFAPLMDFLVRNTP